MLVTVADLCFRARRAVVAVWLLVLAALIVLSAVAAGSTSDDYSIPHSGSEVAGQLLADHGLVDDQAGSLRVVFRDPAGLTTPAGRAAVESVLGQVRGLLPGATVTGPLDEAMRGQLSADGTIGYAQVQLAPGSQAADAARLPDDINPPAGLQVAYAGTMFQPATGGGPGMGVGLLAAVIILFLAFGSVIAMGLPIAVGVFGAGCGVTAVMLTANLVAMSSAAVPLAAMLAVGVGIDYCLFIVTRYRETLATGAAPRQAIAEAYGTAGRAVALAGSTVIVAVLGLLTMRMPLLNGVAIGAALAIALTLAAALTLLPALLGFAGSSIDRFGLRHRSRSSVTGGHIARRWSRSVQRHPWRYTIGSLVILGVLTAPAAAMRLGFPDAGTDPATATTRQAYDLLAEGFGPGVSAPIFAVIDAPPATDGIEQLRGTIADTAGVAAVTPAIPSPDDAITMLVITPTTGPDDAATAQLVEHLRKR